MSEEWEPSGTYIRHSESILGEQNEIITPDFRTSRCFNCGSPDHIVSACPSAADRELISLSRQLYTFTQASRGVIDFKRIHVVEEWRQQRLEWLDVFEPGKIQGPALKDALGSNDGDWLKNIAVWGYPRGWVSQHDPRERVKQLIWNENSDGSADNDSEFPEPFLIITGNDEIETVHSHIHSINEGDSDSVQEESTPPAPPTRWAQFPPSHFASHLLPVYSGRPLPPVSHRGSVTFTTDRQRLWEQIVSGTGDSKLYSLPWRRPGAFDTNELPTHFVFDCSAGPPPPVQHPPQPDTEPPPLPPLPPLLPIESSLPSFAPSRLLDGELPGGELEEEDMDFSESE